MMQAMMYLSALYGVTDIDASMAQLMRIAGMVIVTPVLFYSGAPFLAGAWRDLRHRRLGMDVPVALALVLAWLPSVVNTLRADGEVYFDSVGMFIFFLSAGRFVEMSVRHRSLNVIRGAGAQPARAGDAAAGGRQPRNVSRPTRWPPATDSSCRRAGWWPWMPSLPADLPAEIHALARRIADHGRVRGGAARRGRADSRRQREPGLAAHAHGDRDGGRFDTGVDGAAAGARAGHASADRAGRRSCGLVVRRRHPGAGRRSRRVAWWPIDPARAFAAVLAVLVVTCPCALSLATPVALAAATTRLARLGVLVTRADAIERLARADTVIFDKTGTLTGTASGVIGVKLLRIGFARAGASHGCRARARLGASARGGIPPARERHRCARMR